MTERILELTKSEVLSENTFVHQTESGTIVFRQSKSVWIHNNGQKVSMSGGDIYSIMSAEKDSLFYGSNWKRKIYKADVNQSGAIEIQHEREMIKDEILHQSGMCSIVVDELVYAYRMCDNHIKDRILVNVPVDTLESHELKGMHENTAIFRKMSCEPLMPKVSKIGNAVVLMCYRGEGRRFMERLNVPNDMVEYNSPWGSPAIVPPKSALAYMTNGRTLFAIDVENGELLPQLHFKDVSSFYIAGVYNGMLVGRGKCLKSGKFHLMTAKLPDEYIVEARPPADPPLRTARSKQVLFLKEFTVKKTRGEGGFGRVFEVVNEYDKFEYAVKRIAVLADQLEESLEEVRAMAKLEHPGIVRYNSTWVERHPKGWQNRVDSEILKIQSNFNDDDVFIFIQMKLYKSSLQDWLEANQTAASRALPLMKKWFKDIVTAVRYLHKKEIIHSDLKPGNILFDEDEMPKLCDLGIATDRKIDNGTEITVTRHGAGSKLYMSPEQASIFPQYSSRTDVFALGLIFAELCFDGYRLGEPHNELFNDAETAEFVAFMADRTSKNRPTASQILEHSFLQ